MKHLLDNSTYKIIPEEQALRDVKILSKEILIGHYVTGKHSPMMLSSTSATT